MPVTGFHNFLCNINETNVAIGEWLVPLAGDGSVWMREAERGWGRVPASAARLTFLLKGK